MYKRLSGVVNFPLGTMRANLLWSADSRFTQGWVSGYLGTALADTNEGAALPAQHRVPTQAVLAVHFRCQDPSEQ